MIQMSIPVLISLLNKPECLEKQEFHKNCGKIKKLGKTG